MQIELDPQRCQASGMCAGLVPDRFRPRRGPTLVTQPEVTASSADLAAVIDAIECCPGGALALVQEARQRAEPLASAGDG